MEKHDSGEAADPQRTPDSQPTPLSRPARFVQLYFRALRLRCPMCGQTKLFSGWFKMKSACDQCHAQFEREGGFFLGSIYFNYGLTALVVAIAYPVLLFTEAVPKRPLMIAVVTFTVLFPIWFHRYARALWLGFDEFMDPRE